MKPPDFDAIAPWYERLEKLTFGGALQRCRVALLDYADSARHVLIAGEGDGRFLETLQHACPSARITVVDASQRMIELARRRTGGSANVRFIHGDVLNATLELPEVDLVVTCFFLDCFEGREQSRVIQRLRGCLGPGGRWLWADFAMPETQPMKLLARGGITLLYRFFGAATGLRTRRLTDVKSDFRKFDMRPVATRSFWGGLLATALHEVGPCDLDFGTHSPDARRT